MAEGDSGRLVNAQESCRWQESTQRIGLKPSRTRSLDRMCRKARLEELKKSPYAVGRMMVASHRRVAQSAKASVKRSR
jgi:hypothetical protein